MKISENREKRYQNLVGLAKKHMKISESREKNLVRIVKNDSR